MVTGPPQSGKTSLLQLLHEAAVRSELFSFTYYVNVAENNKSLEQGLVQHGTSWEELFAANSAGMPAPAHNGFPLQHGVLLHC